MLKKRRMMIVRGVSGKMSEDVKKDTKKDV